MDIITLNSYTIFYIFLVGFSFGIYKRSRTFAFTTFITMFMMLLFVFLLFVFSGELISIYLSMFSIPFIILFVFLYFSFEGIRGTFAYHRLRYEEDSNYRPASKKFYFIGLPLLVLPIILGGVAFLVAYGVLPSTSSRQDSLVSTPQKHPALDKLSSKEIFNNNNESVVQIRVYDENYNEVSFGSGVCVNSNGVIITNFHVINSDSFYFDIKFQKQGVFEDVYISGISPILEDYIILRVDAKNLPSVNISTRNEYEVGEKIITIGNPQGLLNSLSEGVISGRRFDGDYEYYQMIAPISKGSSGGAVFDEYGHLVGISTLIIEEGQNLNFFVPVYRINNNAEFFDTSLTIVQFNNLCKERANEYKEKGDQHLLSKDYEQANKSYEISLKYYYSYADAYYAKSTAEYQLGMVDEASADLFMAAVFYYLNDEKSKLLNVKRRAEEMSLPAEVVDMFDIQNMENLIKEYNKGGDLAKYFTSKKDLTKDILPFKEKPTEDSTPLLPEELIEETELKKLDGEEVLQKLKPFFSGLIMSEREYGININDITQGYPAWDAGLRTGDIITEIEGKEIRSLEDYVEIMQKLNKTRKLGIALVVNREEVLYDVIIRRNK